MKKKKKKKKVGKKKEKKVKLKISWKNIFSYGNNLALNSLIALFLMGLAFLIILHHRQMSLKQEQLKNTAPIKQEVIVEKERRDMRNWEKYQSLWYGFELQYPENWEKPQEQKASVKDNWEYRYSFRKKSPEEMKKMSALETKLAAFSDWQWKYLFYQKEAEENIPYSGFDVIIYDVEKVKELTSTEEFSTEIKNIQLKAAGVCDQIAGHLSENSDYPAEKINILSDDDCYNSVFFFSLTRERYIYNIVPVSKEDHRSAVDRQKEAINNFPEFFSVASSFNLIDIKRPKIIPKKPRITAPKPVADVKNANGQRVCAKKNDKPSKSDKGKSKHLDMECCLDPDEYPNPWCYYPPEKYGKYLK